MNNADKVKTFFKAYSAHRVADMLALCADDATFRYVPMGEQGEGAMRQAAEFWQLYMDGFPDFSTEPVSFLNAEDDTVICETIMSGTQGKDIGNIKNKGRKMSNRHLFIFRFNADGLIEKLTGFWDNDNIFAQLGHTEKHD